MPKISGAVSDSCVLLQVFQDGIAGECNVKVELGGRVTPTRCIR